MSQNLSQQPSFDAVDPELALLAARQRFIRAFPTHYEKLSELIKHTPGPVSPYALSEVRQVAHMLTGLAGMVGFPTVSGRARDLEQLFENSIGGAVDVHAVRHATLGLRDAFTNDLPGTTPAAPPIVQTPRAITPLRVLIAEDDPELSNLMVQYLSRAGHTTVLERCGGAKVLERARTQRPDAILLDVNLPEGDGYATCRMLKTDPVLTEIPVIFLTARVSPDDRITGLALGADDYLSKPVDMRELLLRLDILHRRRIARPVASERTQPQGALSYPAFVAEGRPLLVSLPAAVVLMKVPTSGNDEAVIAALRDDLRRRDVIGRYGEHHLVLLLPEMSAAIARERLNSVITRLRAKGITGVFAGVSCSPAPNSKTLDTLIADADEALAEARYLGENASIKSDQPRSTNTAVGRGTMVVVADDDPEVMRILDAQIRMTGHRTILAFDGEQAVANIHAHLPEVLVLDLMMPKLTGFEVLKKLSEMTEARPKVLVLSARGREEDVTRAFELGADDYMTKPFSPMELMARIARLGR